MTKIVSDSSIGFNVIWQENLTKSLLARSKCPKLWVVVEQGFGACEANHRLLLREKIADHVRQNFEPATFPELNKMELLNLASVPKTSLFDVSISHCKVIGGFALVCDGWQIGFDVEESHRLSRSIITRVSSAKEISEAPSWSQLWVAKEAAYKALKEQLQPNTIGDIGITQWKTSNAGIASFEFSNLQSTIDIGYGVSCQKDSLAIGLATINVN